VNNQSGKGLSGKCDKCVLFRLDDIQDDYFSKEQIQIMEIFSQHGNGLTIGIIGNVFNNDTELISYIQEHQGDKLEIANHGWKHEDFSLLPETNQSALMALTNAKIEKLVGVTPLTFITPFNTLNNATSAAMKENGLEIISADNYTDTFHVESGELDPARVDDQARSEIYHFPMNAYMSTYVEEEARWINASRDQVLADIDQGINRDGFSVVMMHPWDDTKKIESVLSSLDSNGYNIVTMKNLRSTIIGEIVIPEFADEWALTVLISGGITGGIVAMGIFNSKFRNCR
jgi:peptidoglycan/xylan/chitin deacetylase (PgdA/CDA1 family)